MNPDRVYIIGLAGGSGMLVAFLWVWLWVGWVIPLPMPMLVLGVIAAIAATVFEVVFWVSVFRRWPEL